MTTPACRNPHGPLRLTREAAMSDEQQTDVVTLGEVGHPIWYVRELGYARPTCGTCEMDWPCPDVADIRQKRADGIPSENFRAATNAPVMPGGDD